MKNRTRKWLRGGIETLIHGGCASFITGLTAPSIIGQTWLPFFSPEWWKMITVSFAANGGVRFFQWWSNNPLPPDDTDPPFPGMSQQISLNPLSKVTPVPK
jgi:hypothetical protein